MLYRLKQPDFVHEDDRGVLKQLIHSGYKQINVIFSKEGTCRGGHYHKINDEAFYIISGSGEIIMNREDHPEKYTFKQGSYFEVLANVRHSFRFFEDTILVSMYSNGVELPDGGKDIYT